MPLLHRKSVSVALTPGRLWGFISRKGGNISVSFIVFAVFLFALFIYEGDIKTITEFPFSGLKTSPPDTNQNPITASSESPVDKNLLLSSNNVQAKKQKKPTPPEKEVEEAEIRKTVAKVPEGCDLFDGWWVYDNETRPMYKEPECRYLTRQVTCMRNGRTDDTFQKWRWQPRGCSLPAFDARGMLERLRSKRLVFVGDSLNRNQWESMVCLVQSVIPEGKKKLVKEGSFNTFTALEYNATVGFYWSPFLVESNSDDPREHSIVDRIIMPESIGKHGVNWKDADYLIFNTYIWWMNTGNMKVLRGTFEEGSTEYDEVERTVAYERVLRTWAAWVNDNVDPRRTTVFFSSMSPLHNKPMEWGIQEGGIRCALEKLPIFDWKQNFTTGTDWRLHEVAANVTRSMSSVPVSFVDITRLSELRKDAHTSVHTLRQGKLLTAEQQKDPAKFADCIHWCLPGLPDTWNELIYARIASAPWRD